MDWVYIPFVAGLGGLVIGIILENWINDFDVNMKRLRKISKYRAIMFAAGIFFIVFSVFIYTNGIKLGLNRADIAIRETARTYSPLTDSTSNRADSTGIVSQSGPSITGPMGDTFGGTLGPLVAFLGVILTFAAFWAQIDANEQQRKDIRLERFENRFFKFIDYHRENVNTLQYRDPKRGKDEVESIEGNRVFTRVFYEIRDLLKACYSDLKPGQIIGHYDLSLSNRGSRSFDPLESYRLLKTAKQLRAPKNLSLKHKAKIIDIVYSCVFFGASSESINILVGRYGERNLNFGFFRTKRATYNRNIYFYGGHVRRLGHYFRNLFQAVKYVDEQDFLSEVEKYKYVTILRAQMSVYEQAVFFYNSISHLGDAWEWQRYKKPPPKQKEMATEFKKLWVTRFDLVRNTLNRDGEISDGVDIGEFYPLINVERDNEFAQCGVLPYLGNTKSLCRYCFNKKYLGYEDDKADQYIRDTITQVVDCGE
jgi:hypothetical protein